MLFKMLIPTKNEERKYFLDWNSMQHAHSTGFIDNNYYVRQATYKNHEQKVNSNFLLQQNKRAFNDGVFAFAFWEKIRDEHPCAICQDLLAVPVKLSCSHRYCLSCIQALISSCDSTSSERRCPICRTSMIGDPSYLHSLDVDIATEVSYVPNCENKNNWKERRNKLNNSGYIYSISDYVAQPIPNSNSFVNTDEDLIIVGIAAVLLSIIGIVFFNKHC